MYREKFRNLLLSGVLGMVIGVVFITSMESNVQIGEIIMVGLMFAGLPYGWKLSGRVVGGGVVVGHIVIMLFVIAFRFAIALMTGCIAYPVVLIYTVIQMMKENRGEPKV